MKKEKRIAHQEALDKAVDIAIKTAQAETQPNHVNSRATSRTEIEAYLSQLSKAEMDASAVLNSYRAHSGPAELKTRLEIIPEDVLKAYSYYLCTVRRYLQLIVKDR